MDGEGNHFILRSNGGAGREGGGGGESKMLAIFLSYCTVELYETKAVDFRHVCEGRPST